MSIAEITEKVIQNALKEKEEIIKEAEKRTEEIEKEVAKEKKALKEEAGKITQKALEERRKKTVSAVTQKNKSVNDSLKREALNRVFEKVLEKIENSNDKEYERIIKCFLDKIPGNLNGRVILPQAKESITKKILEDKGVVLDSEVSDGFKGGFILKGEDFEYNFTFNRIVENMKEREEVEVSAMLFEN